MKSKFLKALKTFIEENEPKIFINFISIKQVSEAKKAIEMLIKAEYVSDNVHAPQQTFTKGSEK